MTALSADLNLTDGIHPVPKTRHTIIKSSSVMYRDAASAIEISSGYTKPWTGVAGEMLYGRWGTGATTGDATDSPRTTGGVNIDDEVIENVAVAGLASSSFQQDVLKYVYLGTDRIGVDLTLTRPAAPNRTPFGIVINGRSATKCDVLRFGLRTQLVLSNMGTNVRTICLGAIGAETPSAQNLLTGIVMSGHGKILDTYAICVNASTDADWTQLVNLEIDAVDVTGGVITTATADAQGDKKSGTAITGTNEFHDGALLDVEAATVTAGTANNGLYNLYITVEYLPGL